MSQAKFFVYCLYRPWDGRPCYIGKGSGRRHEFHKSLGERHHNRHLANIFKKAGDLEVPCRIIYDNLEEETAFFLERELIAAIGRSDLGKGPLCNQTDGGEGSSGLLFNQNMRDQRRSSALEQYHNDIARGFRPCNSPASIAKRAASNLGQKREASFCEGQRIRALNQHQYALETDGAAFHKPESQAKAAFSRIGNKNAAGKPQSIEANMRRSATLKGVPKSPEAITNMKKARNLRALRESGALRHA